MPALLTRASIDPNLLLATPAIFAAVAGSAMFPSTKASRSDASNARGLVIVSRIGDHVVTTLQECVHDARSDASRAGGHDRSLHRFAHRAATICKHRAAPRALGGASHRTLTRSGQRHRSRELIIARRAYRPRSERPR